MEKAQNLLISSKDTLNSVTNLPLDTIILIAVFIVLFAYGLHYGKYKIISLILSLYVAIPVFSYFPYTQIFSFFAESEKAILYSQIVFFLIIVVFFNIIIGKFMVEEFSASGFKRFIDDGFLAAAGGGLLLMISYHIIPITLIYDFAAPIDILFLPATMLFWWLVIPFIILLFTFRR
ncbi:hypothetical protein COT82_01380 [Candidatus Campbellbacteria bacterium CG10_big_fil_rev_8_21_14_0_10_35_52]|uniref:CvpA family protein n=1 Tax=Candidatus Campbellbacteria bacterium CG10_big_fil_rev_8_21_14_0_10_35_52 TaxID=1974527 RepID=A0A2M6WVM4_9BACT|nr:MAG: hypothetical protein COT82_01380 [Candidatus Campbellbacteria bacterium CG10_big_fil_rev_8_21_14_0_10_35_52]